jgi:hypothetical protein
MNKLQATRNNTPSTINILSKMKKEEPDETAMLFSSEKW